RQCPERPVPVLSHPEPGEQPLGAFVVQAVILLTPAPEYGVGGRHHDVQHTLVARDRFGDRRAGHSDSRPELEHVDAPQGLTEDGGDAAGGVHARGGDLQQRRLAGAVGAEDHPPVAFVDGPAHAVEQLRAVTHDRDVGELEYWAHEGTTYGTTAW